MNNSSKDEQLSDLEFLARIARMSYIMGLTQNEIAVQLGISRSSIARYLIEARELGLVQIRIRSSYDQYRSHAYEDALKNQFSLKDCFVISDFEDDAKSFYSLASAYMDGILPFEGTVALGWGNTISRLEFHNITPRPNLNLVQCIGGFGIQEANIPASSVIQHWAHALRCKSFLIPAPAFTKEPHLKDLLLQDPSIKGVLDLAISASVVVVGIGTAAPLSTLVKALLPDDTVKRILTSGSEGEILHNYFDGQGNPTCEEVSMRKIGMSRDHFLRIPLRIGVANGSEKLGAISAALRGGLINVLVTTESTINKLLKA